ncbi:hypothetical protein, partial [Shewanella algae]|uniref:hypothetical protein n=1 Tax=Shewanella algae TaxID=38313 RepID=UPI00313DFB4F
TNNHALISLAKELGLETQSLVEEDEQIETELFDFEGVLRTHKDLVEAVAPAVEIIQKAKAGGAEGFTYLTANPKRIKWDKMNLLQ